MSAFAFATPILLIALAALPAIWWLLRITPPRPEHEVFPPLRILAGVMKREETPASSPWWLTLLRMILAALIIIALAGPQLNPNIASLAGGGPLTLVIDNGWASAPDWQQRVQTAGMLINEASTRDLTVSLVFTADTSNDATPIRADAALEKLAAASPKPLKPDRDRAIAMLKSGLDGQTPGTLAFISDGISNRENDDVLTRLGGLGASDFKLISGQASQIAVLSSAANSSDSLSVTARRLDPSAPAILSLSARDTLGRSIASGTIEFKTGETEASGIITAPFELRNEFARLTLDVDPTAGSVRLLDDSFKRRRVALISGESGDRSQPLLSPLYYIERALAPYANLTYAKSSDLSVAVTDLIAGNPSAIIMADIGRVSPATTRALVEWMAKGGILIRFAGPRLAASATDDQLVPVMLRQGERALGGAMSWSTPQPLAAYPATGPFAGLDKPQDIFIQKQVLAEPSPELAARSWANLEDGTPLVTSRKSGAGRIVLFHVSADASWSNLPISGHFVEMLRRVVQLSRAFVGVSDDASGDIVLPAYRLLTATGTLTPETSGVKPLIIKPGKPATVTADNPPGLYGTEDGFEALNLIAPTDKLFPIDPARADFAISQSGLAGQQATSLKPALLGLAFMLGLADTLIVLFLAGALTRARNVGQFAAIALPLMFLMQASPGLADDSKPGDDLLLARLDKTHIAYVMTGEEEVDTISQRGMTGLSDFLFYRTTLEPGDPVGVDISKDELSVFPLIYWPVSATAPMPSAAAISRIDAYMRSGGTVLFDTRDQFSGLALEGATSSNTRRMQEILSGIDIPPLEQVPSDHVLTKSFYLLKEFPGRYTGSPLWIEALPKTPTGANRPVRGGDGVSPIMITGNDFAGAWAIDANGAPLLPTIPSDENQREFAFRTGVNIMMYMLTGNYKADQVHVPALLERLGQ